jgi:hypothetical protein
MGDSEKRLVVVQCMVVKTHLIDGENDAFVARCKLAVALVGAVASAGSSR